MMVELTFFGKLADLMGVFTQSTELPEAVTDTEALRHWLDDRNGLQGQLTSASVRIALNDEIVGGATPISSGDRLAFLPPVGGG